MYVRYGSFQHEAKDLSFQPVQVPVRTPMGEVFGIEHRISCTGSIFGDSQSALIQGIEAVMSAYSQDGKDFAVYFNDGTKVPDIQILNRDTIGGVQVARRPTLDPRNAAEYSSYWDYSFEIYAVVRRAAANARTIWSLEETISFKGNGGPPRTYIKLKYEKSRVQRPGNFTNVTATQTGTIVGLNGYLEHLVPRPRWSYPIFDNESDGASRRNPRRVNGSPVEYPVSWTYSFEHTGPFPGSPYPSF